MIKNGVSSLSLISSARSLGAIGLVILALGLSPSHALGQTVAYRVTWLTDPSNPAGLGGTMNLAPDAVGSMGINNKGQVCFGYKPGSDVRAWVWLPSSDYSMSAGWHDIGSTADLPNIARDLNESGLVVGQSGGVFVFNPVEAGDATVWTLRSTVTSETYDAIGGNNPWSGAHAINDDDPPIIVGVSSIQRPCSCPPGEGQATLRAGFTLVLGDEMDELLLPDDEVQQQNSGQDVNTPLAGDPMIAGWATCRHVSGCGAEPQSEPCNPEWLAVKWNDAGAVEAVLEKVFEDTRAEARAVNNGGWMAGFGLKYVQIGQGFNCDEIAYLWEPDGDVWNLGAYMPEDQEDHKSRAEAINSEEYPSIVGWNVNTFHALMWKVCYLDPNCIAASDFLVWDLNDRIGCTDWEILQAHDINDDGWIVAIAENESLQLGSLAAVLLTPLGPCPLDVNQDGCITTADFFLVWYGAGDCPPSQICYKDVNGDCTVNSTDYWAVLNALCEGCSGACCANCDCGDSSSAALGAAIAAVLSSELSEEAQHAAIDALVNP